MSMTDRKAELWIGWTRDAARNYAIPEEIENLDELVDDMAEVCTAYADEMLDQFEERFDASSTRKQPEPHRRRASPRRKSRDEDAGSGRSEREED